MMWVGIFTAVLIKHCSTKSSAHAASTGSAATIKSWMPYVHKIPICVWVMTLINACLIEYYEHTCAHSLMYGVQAIFWIYASHEHFPIQMDLPTAQTSTGSNFSAVKVHRLPSRSRYVCDVDSTRILKVWLVNTRTVHHIWPCQSKSKWRHNFWTEQLLRDDSVLRHKLSIVAG